MYHRIYACWFTCYVTRWLCTRMCCLFVRARVYYKFGCVSFEQGQVYQIISCLFGTSEPYTLRRKGRHPGFTQDSQAANFLAGRLIDTEISDLTLLSIATHCHTLPSTATHRNTLQHTATEISDLTFCFISFWMGLNDFIPHVTFYNKPVLIPRYDLIDDCLYCFEQ